MIALGLSQDTLYAGGLRSAGAYVIATGAERREAIHAAHSMT